MASVKSSSKYLIVTIGSSAIAIDFASKQIHRLDCDLKKFPATCNINKSDFSSKLDETVFLPCSDLSHCNEWFIFSFKKCLMLWKTADWTLYSFVELQRSAVKIKFSADASKIIIVDKSGDVFSYNRKDLSEDKKTLILGHLCLMFDVVFTPDDKFIITCDRDEKIRVSHYPNSYNINSYCLGHEEFITSMNILPHCSAILISVSGDETLRLWNYKSGTEILYYNCFNDINPTFVEVEEGVPFNESIAITKCISFITDTEESIVCIICSNFKGCILYSIKGSPEKISCKKLNILSLDSTPFDIYYNGEILWVTLSLNSTKLTGFIWNNDKKMFEPINSNLMLNIIEKINKELINFECNFKNKISILYKKQMHETQETSKRKTVENLNSEVYKKIR